MEFPVRTHDGEKKVDIVLETIRNDKKHLIVMEWKRDKIDLGVVEQVERYARYTKLQLYKDNVVKFIAGPDFSDFEIEMCKEHNVHALQFDLKGNMRIVI